jgi:ubiquinone/menaquinone biosynthesis C-methylase UbiE
MSLRLSYRLLAPYYDWVAGPAFAAARRRSLAHLPRTGRCTVLLNGVGTGLDLVHAPAGHHYVALDLTRAMLRRAMRRSHRLDVSWVEGDSLALPFADTFFDYAVLHLILAVVPDAGQALRETARVLRRGGTALILDKFLRSGQRAPLRRMLSPLAARIATRTDVEFEAALAQSPQLRLEEDAPLLAGGWFRVIRLVKE